MSEAQVENIKFDRGDDEDIKINFPTDITGWTIYFTVKERDVPDTEAIIQETATMTDPTNGKAIIELSSVDTSSIDANESYFYDVQYIDNDGKSDTFLKGKVIWDWDKTRSTS